MHYIIIMGLIATAFSQCNHPIFCEPSILQIAADSKKDKDSKTFVDLTLKVSVEQALANSKIQSPIDFIENNFDTDPDILLSPVTFPDFKQNPQIIGRIHDPELKLFAKQLNKRWNQLGKRIDLSKAQQVGSCKSNCSSFLPQADKMTILVPGGRFRQSYYWDSYWIILGLIASDMLQTAETLLNNFAKIIEKYGFIPNGFRQYFLNRSQPPYFFMMIQAVTKALKSKGKDQQAQALQSRMFPVLQKQHSYWENTHQLIIFTKGDLFKVNQYRASTTSPRPESYKEDLQTVKGIVDPKQKARILQGISSVAESGHDFSSRWLKGTTLKTVDIEQKIPSDLNALLGLMQKYLAELSEKYSGNKYKISKYSTRFGQRLLYFKAIKSEGRFPDFNIAESSSPSQVYPTDFLPFLLFDEKRSVSDIYKDVVNPVSSFKETQQQWDYPNVWAPNNWIIHEMTPPEQAKRYATEWVSTTYCSYKKHGALYEKYVNSKLGERGEGGEYEAQVGFGWTNGLALYYLNLYPDLKKLDC